VEQTKTVGRGSGKRERLVEGAQGAFHEQGVERTTLADVASRADVPLGNVYYYFKTKDQLVEAALEAHADAMREMLRSAERHRTPRARLKAMVRAFGEQRDVVAQRGCPVGTLCSELDKRDDELVGGARAALMVPIDWAEREFREAGRPDARDLAVGLFAAYQGIALIANTLRDPSLIARETRRLERWIDSLT
jgi:TetR/AcrR family transcriptional regulator, transcriptional repressor for nem operon